LASLSAAARDDVHERDQGDDGHRSDGNDGDRGRGDDHLPFLSYGAAVRTLGCPPSVARSASTTIRFTWTSLSLPVRL
jgi:hypothetical protein